MALATRSTRRRGAKLWLAVGIVITLLVLLVDASLKSRSPAPAQTLAAQAWVDRVLPVISQSTEQGLEINHIRTSGLTMKAAAINSQLSKITSAARSDLATVESLRPAPNVEAANGLLIACLQTRAAAASTFAQAITRTLAGPATASAAQVPTLLGAVEQFQVADQAYQLFAKDVPPLGVKMPASAWSSNAHAYNQPALTTYLRALRSSTNSLPVHDVTVSALSTTPGAVSTSGKVQVLPPANLVKINVTIANVGNQAANNVPVKASFSPGASGYLSSGSRTVSVSPGQDVALTVATLKAPTNVAVTLTVTVGPVAGQTDTAGATQTLVFKMP